MARLTRRAALRLTAHAGIAAGLGFLLAPVTRPAQAQPAAPSITQPARSAARQGLDTIDTYIQERMAAWSVPGLSLALVLEGKPAVTRGYGLADREQSRPMTPQTPIAVGSTTKPMTTAAVLQLVEAGMVELDAPVTRYLDWFRLDDPRSTDITVRQLLNHTSGIPASASLDGHQEPDELERRVRSLEWERLSSAPGTRFEYSNDAFNTAGLIVQVVSGLPFEQYMNEKVLVPIRMTRSTFDPARAAELGMAQGYLKRKGELRPEKTRLTRSYNPAGMLVTCAEDSGRFLAAMLNGGQLDGARVLTEDSVSQMETPTVHINDSMAYGLGWFVSQRDGVKAVLHPGEILTMGSMFAMVPQIKLGVAVLANLDNDGKDEIAEGVIRLLLGLKPVLREVPRIGAENTFVPDRAVWDRYVGTYETSQGDLQIRRDGDTLVGVVSSFRFELEPISDTQFVIHTEISAFDETIIELRPEADGSVSLYVKGQRFGVKR
ncbi:MAG: serine hydrolase domain-containing protein [Chloroflexota bacterium]